MSKSLARWGFLPLVAAIIVMADQWTKGLIEKNLALGGTYAPFPALEPYFKLVYFRNTGAAFGILQGYSGLFSVIAVVAIVVALIYAGRLPASNGLVRALLGLPLGGALGNLVDRLQHQGQVTDFLLFTLPVGDRVYAWPAWNVADASIVVGVILLGLLLLRAEGAQSQGVRPTSELEAANADAVSGREADSE